MSDPIVILHGWGSLVGGEKRFGVVKKLLEKKGFRVFTPDLPGFGSNKLKKEELFFEDYVQFVKSFIEKNKLKKVILLGHSFGGRIAIEFSAKYPKYVSKLILVSPSGIPHSLSFKKQIVSVSARIGKKVFQLRLLKSLYKPLRKAVYYAIGEMDYFKSGNLKKTFKNIYQVSIVNDLPRIHMPTLIVWGRDDTFVPVADGQFMHEKIKNSHLEIIEHEGHKFPYENPEKFVLNILTFLP